MKKLSIFVVLFIVSVALLPALLSLFSGKDTVNRNDNKPVEADTAIKATNKEQNNYRDCYHIQLLLVR